jgi:hypothetical protein
MLGDRPELHHVLWISLLHRLHYRRQGFLQAAYAAGSAGTWRGRGTLEVQPRRRSTSHPRWGCTRRPSVALIQAAAFSILHVGQRNGVGLYAPLAGGRGRRPIRQHPWGQASQQ